MEDASSSCYERHAYSALPDGHIRLAKFDKDPRRDGRIICSFEHYDLNGSMPYNAVSYCWGDPTPVAHLVTAKNLGLPLSRSADNILQGLVPRYMNAYYWIDQICIDQENAVEKSKQVSMMGNIYASAFRVIAWLGNSHAWGEEALRFASTLSVFFAKVHQLVSGIPAQPLPQTSVHPDQNEWHALRRLLYHPWFQRQWIVQEVLMAPFEQENERPALYLAYGAVSIPWDIFSWTLVEIASRKLESLLQPDMKASFVTDTNRIQNTNMEIPGLTTTLVLATLRDARRKGQDIPLSRALITCESFRVADPRDKLYSVIGFASCSFPVQPDYLTSVEEIYTELGHRLLAHEKNLISLHSAGIGWNQALAALPSWVPDWTTPHAPISMGNIAGKCNSRSSLDTEHRLDNDRRRHILGVSGHAVCTIKALFPRPSKGNARAIPLAAGLVFFKDSEWITTIRDYVTEPLASPPLSDHQIDTSIALTLVAHSWNEESEAETIKKFRSWDMFHRHLFEDGNFAKSFIHALLDEELGNGANRISSPERRAFLHYARRLEYFTNNRIAFGTSEHRLLGLGPPKAQVGDLVAVLHGARTPFLLRPHKAMDVLGGTTKTWQLVGDCYVHGIMNGEGMSMAPEQTFTLV